MKNVKLAGRGGTRKGAGRPPNTGRYGEPTVPVRVPVSLVTEVQRWVEDEMKKKNKEPHLSVVFEDK